MNLPLTLVGILLSASTFSQADISEVTEQSNSKLNTEELSMSISITYETVEK